MDTTKKPSVKILFILIDGIGELNIQKIDNKTPLQYLDLPHINALASTGPEFHIDYLFHLPIYRFKWSHGPC